MIVLAQLVFSIIVTSTVWLGGALFGYLIHSTMYTPEKLKTIAAAFEHQTLHAMLTGVLSDPVFLSSGLLVGALIILYDKFLLVGMIMLMGREVQQNSKTTTW
jgi:hypothetical protein